MLRNGLTLKVSLISENEAETRQSAKDLASQLKPGDIVLLQGDLGAGKTSFVKGMVEFFKINADAVTSPTFVLMNYYKGNIPVYHFDLYRLENPKEIAAINFDDYFFGDGISLIEWPERLGDQFFKRYYLVDITHKGEHQRGICIYYPLTHQQKSLV